MQHKFSHLRICNAESCAKWTKWSILCIQYSNLCKYSIMRLLFITCLRCMCFIKYSYCGEVWSLRTFTAAAKINVASSIRYQNCYYTGICRPRHTCTHTYHSVCLSISSCEEVQLANHDHKSHKAVGEYPARIVSVCWFSECWAAGSVFWLMVLRDGYVVRYWSNALNMPIPMKNNLNLCGDKPIYWGSRIV